MDYSKASTPPNLKETVERRLRYWIDRLHDMTRRNRLLYFRQTKASTLEISHPSIGDLFQRLVVSGRFVKFPLPSDEDQLDLLAAEDEPIRESQGQSYGHNEISTTSTDKHVQRVLYNLRSRARSAQEEQGVNLLYTCFGMLEWKEANDAETSFAPLVLVPVKLERGNLAQPYEMSVFDDDIVANPSLAAKMKQDFRLELAEIDQELDSEQLKAYLNAVRFQIQDFDGWNVSDQVVIGIFNFQNLRIIKDIEKHWDSFISNGFIQALASQEVTLPMPEAEIFSATELDDRVPPDRQFQVLDADSSQQEAIEAAKLGLSFILQGPPGTGKSQTIANLIAEFMYAGKRVLFVSQKSAALEVVQRRLDEVGLGEFVLQVHSHKRDKKEVVAELGEALEAGSSQAAAPSPRQLHSELLNARAKLNAYVRALHREHLELGITAFQASGELAAVEDAPQIDFRPQSIETTSPSEHRRQLEIIESLTAFPEIITSGREYPWYGCRLNEFSLDFRSRVQSALERLAEDTETFGRASVGLADLYAVSLPMTLQESSDIVRVAAHFRPEVLDLPLSSLHANYSAKYSTITRYLYPSYWKDSASLKRVMHTGKRPDPKQAADILTAASRVLHRGRKNRGRAQEFSSADIANRVADVKATGKRIVADRRFIMDLFEADSRPQILVDLYRASPKEVFEWCRFQAQRVNLLGDWFQFLQSTRDANVHNLGEFVANALRVKAEPDDWEGAYLSSFYSSALDAIRNLEPDLYNFSGRNHQRLIERFRELDRDQLEITKKLIHARLLDLRPNAAWVAAASAEESILRREMNKRRLKPLRKLFREIPDLLPRLKPCLMMSPLTVSQMLDPELHRFDLALFDEASQVRPEYAVGTMIRTNQVVLAGDRHQLPPTRFFDALDGDNFDQDIDEFESILNECDAAGFPSKSLLWHYRSQDESLIAFSNYHFYNNRLYTFPSASPDDNDTGLEFVQVPGAIYRRGRGGFNPDEARKVIDLVIDHFENRPEASLGVVTFSEAQKAAIDQELETRLRSLPAIQPLISDEGPEPFFVKSLEQVQGDERDVIIFSVGYGFDEGGKLTMNFGPLSRAGGERRLNVAVTRAKRKVKLVASIQPEDIDLRRTSAKGAQLLHNYMLVARDGVKSLYAQVGLDPFATFGSPFEEAVHDSLVAKGLSLEKQVGVSGYRIDLAVVDQEKPGRFVLGIECDGAMYHSAATARDRDRIRQQVLEGLGWRIHRIWSRDWIENRGREIEKVLTAVKTAVDSGVGSNPHPGNAPTHSSGSEPSPKYPRPIPESRSPEFPPNTEIYMPIRLQRQGHGAESFHRAPSRRLEAAVEKVVELEGPIHIELVSKRLADAWGVARVGKRIRQAIGVAVGNAQARRTVVQRGDFLWPPGLRRPTVRMAKSGQAPRSINEIPIEELVEAAHICVGSALSIEREDLVRETAKLFGIRASRKSSARLDTAIDSLLHEGRIVWRGNKLRLPRN